MVSILSALAFVSRGEIEGGRGKIWGWIYDPASSRPKYLVHLGDIVWLLMYIENIVWVGERVARLFLLAYVLKDLEGWLWV